MTTAARSSGGFTLIEMLVVVSIMSVLAMIALPLAELSAKRSKEEELRSGLRQIRGAIDRYKQLVDMGHVIRVEGASGYPPDLSVLTSGVPDAKSAKGEMIFILRRLPRDPFAADDLAAEQTWRLRSYQSPPDAPVPGADVFDVRSGSDGVGLNGVPYAHW
ncbi:type II secretion system protein [Aquabacterium lacunae]|uniref:Type II secretion system protein n=1 Tax=Aquabacterium lacunae TaxID=2528630 RepID=A0A4Q9GYC4_9BURK|nr:type II secretion system protein [Aquabacterium lacunae]TBO30446.1 type II secretion system protein [Aquabacterium lacunae]